MTRLGTLVTSTVVAALVSAAPDVSAQVRRVLPGGEIRPVASALNGAVEGVVYDDGGAPVVGATVSALGATSALAITDRAGRFALRALPPGPYLVRAHSTGYVASRRQFVEVRASSLTRVSVSMRRADQTRVLAAGVSATDDPDADDHSEVAWRLRHLPRSVLKDVDTGLYGDAKRTDDTSGFARAVGSPARLASALFYDLPFTGQVNLLTTGSFDNVQRLFSSDTLSSSVASLSVGGPVGGWGDWAIQGITSQGDLGSWFVSGALKSRGHVSHAYDVNVSYSTLRFSSSSGAKTGVPVTAAEDSRAVGTVHGLDRWQLSPEISLTYAAGYSRYDYMGGSGYLSPRAELTIKPAPSVRFRTSVSRHVLAPGAEEFMPPISAGVWVPSSRMFDSLPGDSLRAERAKNYEFAVEHDWGRGYTLTARTFFQEVDNQLVALFGFDDVAADRSSGSRYRVGDVGNVDSRGWGVSFGNSSHRYLRGSISYRMVASRWYDSHERPAASVAPALVRTSERLHDVTTTLETEVPRAATRIYVLYKFDTAFARTITDDKPAMDGRFDVQVLQPLPLLDFTSAQWQLVFAVRNLFREASPDGSIYDELLVVRPPKRLVGGLVIRF